MGYGHAEKLAAIVAGTPAVAEADTPPIDPALYRREHVRRVLAERDIGGLFRVLRDDAGLNQRTIAGLVGMSQSEVSEILKGRKVRDVTVLERSPRDWASPASTWASPTASVTPTLAMRHHSRGQHRRWTRPCNVET